MTNNDFILNLGIDLDKEHHEQEILRNILDRTTRDYISLREKLACKAFFDFDININILFTTFLF